MIIEPERYKGWNKEVFYGLVGFSQKRKEGKKKQKVASGSQFRFVHDENKKKEIHEMWFRFEAHATNYRVGV